MDTVVWLDAPTVAITVSYSRQKYLIHTSLGYYEHEMYNIHIRVLISNVSTESKSYQTDNKSKNLSNSAGTEY